jgi:hypothetical protein
LLNFVIGDGTDDPNSEAFAGSKRGEQESEGNEEQEVMDMDAENLEQVQPEEEIDAEGKEEEPSSPEAAERNRIMAETMDAWDLTKFTDALPRNTWIRPTTTPPVSEWALETVTAIRDLAVTTKGKRSAARNAIAGRWQQRYNNTLGKGNGIGAG